MALELGLQLPRPQLVLDLGLQMGLYLGLQLLHLGPMASPPLGLGFLQCQLEEQVEEQEVEDMHHNQEAHHNHRVP
jgi:hypothetical protein